MPAPGEPIFWLRIVDKKGQTVTIPDVAGGSRLERDLILAITDQIIASAEWQQVAADLRDDILARRVGFFSTSKRVGRKIDVTLHTKLRGLLTQHVHEGIQRAMQQLKDLTVVVA